MKKIVINDSYGEFCVSHTAWLRLRELGQQEALREPDLDEHRRSWDGPPDTTLNRFGSQIPRNDERLVQVVEELGAEADGHCANLKIVEIPAGVEWTLEKHEGRERVSEVHRSWT